MPDATRFLISLPLDVETLIEETFPDAFRGRPLYERSAIAADIIADILRESVETSRLAASPKTVARLADDAVKGLGRAKARPVDPPPPATDAPPKRLMVTGGPHRDPRVLKAVMAVADAVEADPPPPPMPQQQKRRAAPPPPPPPRGGTGKRPRAVIVEED